MYERHGWAYWLNLLACVFLVAVPFEFCAGHLVSGFFDLGLGLAMLFRNPNKLTPRLLDMRTHLPVIFLLQVFLKGFMYYPTWVALLLLIPAVGLIALAVKLGWFRRITDQPGQNPPPMKI